jgi:hypothetical protein
MRIRTRSKPAIEVTLFEHGWNTTTSPFWTRVETNSSFAGNPLPWSLSNAYPSLSETIRDEKGNDGHFRFCEHDTVVTEARAPEHLLRYLRGSKGNAYARSVTTVDSSASQGLRVMPVVDLDGMAEEAMAFMLPSINEGSSLINFIYELKDFKRYPEIWRRLRKSKHGILRSLSNPPSRKKVTKRIIHNMAEAHLETSFGIVPFVSDVVSMYDELAGLAFKLTALKRHANKELVRHYKRIIPESPGIRPDREWVTSSRLAFWNFYSVEHDGDGGDRAQFSVRRAARWVQRPTYHATMRYSYSLPDMDRPLEMIWTHLDSLGVRLDPGIIWDAIPFSFLIDWVVDVSGFLHSFARDNYPIVTNVKEFCHSLAYHSMHMISVNPTWGVTGGTFAPPLIPLQSYTDVWEQSRRYYIRKTASPSTHASSVKRLNLRKAALAGSLLITASNRRLHTYR